jgi:predicted acyl esterase
MGISWGGFNALRVAATRPEGLRAVVSACASGDRYAADAHYLGGCLWNENVVWGAALFTLGALPRDPRVWGDRWRTLWLERLEAATPFPSAGSDRASMNGRFSVGEWLVEPEQTRVVRGSETAKLDRKRDARGRKRAKVYRDASEEEGWILAASNNARNVESGESLGV